MELLIEFHEGIDSLNDDEFNQFILSFGRSKVTAIVFKALLDEYKNNQITTVNAMNALIADIRINNDAKHEEGDSEIVPFSNNEEERVPITLDEMPYVMISKICTYLLFAEHLKFEKVSRAVFIGSRSSRIPIHPFSAHSFAKFVKFYHDNDGNTAFPLRLFKSLIMDSDHLMKWNDKIHESTEYILKYKWNYF